MTTAGGDKLTILKDADGSRNFKAIGCRVDDATDDSTAFAAACAIGGRWRVPEGNMLLSTFGTTLGDGTLAAVRVASDLVIEGPGTIKSNTVTATRAIFGIDPTSGTVSLELRGVKFAGDTRYRALYVQSDATTETLVVDGCETERQSIIIAGDVTRSLRVTDNKIGTNILAATAVTPTLSIVLPEGPTYNPECVIERNIVWSGTEVIAGAPYVIHGLPMGGRCNYNTHINIGAAANEGFDIDNVGRFAQVIGNVCYGTGFEYKVGSGGYSDSRDIIFSHNISMDAVVPFTIRSSCVGFGNIAYNPSTYGIFCTPGSDTDSLLDDATFQLSGFRIIYAGGSPWTAAVKIDGGMSGMTFDGLRIELDPAWKAANPTGKMPNTQINIDGDVSNLTIRNAFIDKSTGDHINVRPTTRASNLHFENIQFGEAGDSCFDLLDCDNVRIINPVFPSTIADRPIRMTTCNTVKIEADYTANIDLAQTSGSNTGVRINNWGTEAAGAGILPTATSIWPLGCIVRNSDDGTVWLRVSQSTTKATAWKQIA